MPDYIGFRSQSGADYRQMHPSSENQKWIKLVTKEETSHAEKTCFQT